MQSRDCSWLFSSFIFTPSVLPARRWLHNACEANHLWSSQWISYSHLKTRMPVFYIQDLMKMTACESYSFLTPKLGLEQHVWLCTVINISCRCIFQGWWRKAERVGRSEPCGLIWIYPGGIITFLIKSNCFIYTAKQLCPWDRHSERHTKNAFD